MVHGRVQGVFFRDSARREAVTREVSGWARNRADGTVEAVFEGDEGDVQAMVRWCRAGPPRATVTSIDVFDEEPSGESGFAIR